MPRTTLLLQLCDSTTVEVEYELVKACLTIAEMVKDEDGESEEGSSTGPLMVPLPNVNKETMDDVLAFARHAKGAPLVRAQAPLKNPDIKEAYKADPQLARMIEEVRDRTDDHAALFELILAANYLQWDDLLDATCAALASLLKNKTPDEIRTHFGIPAPTPEEEEAIKKSNQWIFDVRPVDAPPVPVVAAAPAGPAAPV